jgi:hypothetical protein
MRERGDGDHRPLRGAEAVGRVGCVCRLGRVERSLHGRQSSMNAPWGTAPSPLVVSLTHASARWTATRAPPRARPDTSGAGDRAGRRACGPVRSDERSQESGCSTTETFATAMSRWALSRCWSCFTSRLERSCAVRTASSRARASRTAICVATMIATRAAMYNSSSTRLSSGTGPGRVSRRA